MRARGIGALLAVIAGIGPAGAEEVSGADVIAREMHKLGKQLVLRLDMFQVDEDHRPTFGGFGLANVNFDLDHRRGRITLAAGRPAASALKLDANFLYRKSAACAFVRLDIAILEHVLTVVLPEVQLRPRSVMGETALEATVPLVEGRF